MSLESQIETAAGKAKRLKSGDEEREAHSLGDLIKADEHLSAKNATSNSNRRGIVINKLRPPGSI